MLDNNKPLISEIFRLIFAETLFKGNVLKSFKKSGYNHFINKLYMTQKETETFF